MSFRRHRIIGIFLSNEYKCSRWTILISRLFQKLLHSRSTTILVLVRWVRSCSARTHLSLLDNSACILVESETCTLVERTHVVLLNKHTCIIVPSHVLRTWYNAPCPGAQVPRYSIIVNFCGKPVIRNGLFLQRVHQFRTNGVD